MKRIWGILLLAVAACMASAQQSQPSRVDAIWNHAVDRLNGQTDIWFDDGDFPRVINLCKVMYALYPDDFEIATNLGWMLENVLRWDEALAVYIKFRTENPKDPDSAWPEANFYYMKKAYQKIPAILEPSMKMSTKPHPNSFRTLAHAYERMNQLQDSKRVWQSMILAFPKDAPAKNNLSRVEKKLRGAGPGKSG
ncbi:MAG: tetratricopeptide repeat protein [Chlorobia bacterium]|nr:tetratricopeptide repeat protein [Fimbriimonadaceae bacterium]